MPKVSTYKITKRLVDTLRPDPSGRDLFIWDCELRGFGVRVLRSGSASYLVQYQTTEGRTRRLKLAALGELTPDEARSLAREKLGAVAKGGDPSAERHKARDAKSVAELCDAYLGEADGRVKASTLAMDRSRIETHVRPLIGRRPAISVTLEDIERLQADIAAGKTARERNGRGGVTTGGRGVAARTVGMLGTIFEWARRRKLIDENPVRGVQKYREGKQRRFLSVEEIGRLGEAMRSAVEEGENPVTIACIRFLLTTGLRRMEALGLPWSWVDFQSRCIRFADTKSGAQMRPIGTEAARVLTDLPRVAGSPWVFPGLDASKHVVGLPKVLGRLCARAGLEGVTVHVLRHAFAATAAEAGFSELTIAGLLGHTVPGVTARYAHVPDAALLVAADHVSARIAAALDGRDAAEVVALPSVKIRAVPA
ncbi:MAG: tyrosine-type recombinase/integrase [Methylocella sp.]